MHDDEEWFEASNLPSRYYSFLAESLPPNGLQAFLDRNSNTFEYLRKEGKFRFRVRDGRSASWPQLASQAVGAATTSTQEEPRIVGPSNYGKIPPPDELAPPVTPPPKAPPPVLCKQREEDSQQQTVTDGDRPQRWTRRFREPPEQWKWYE